MAFGIFNTGSAVGAVIAPPLLALIAYAVWGWRWVFYITGGVGLLMAWAHGAMCYRPTRRTLASRTRNGSLIATAQAEEQSLRSGRSGRLPCAGWTFSAFARCEGLMLAKFLSDAAWFFADVWMAKYLGDVRGLDIKNIGYFAWIPWASRVWAA